MKLNAGLSKSLHVLMIQRSPRSSGSVGTGTVRLKKAAGRGAVELVGGPHLCGSSEISIKNNQMFAVMEMQGCSNTSDTDASIQHNNSPALMKISYGSW